MARTATRTATRTAAAKVTPNHGKADRSADAPATPADHAADVAADAKQAKALADAAKSTPDTATPAKQSAADVVRSTLLLPTKKADRTSHLLKELKVLDDVPTDAAFPFYVDQVGINSITRLRSAEHRTAVRSRIVKALAKVKAPNIPADPHTADKA